MFDLGASEILLIAIVAIIVIGPKDMPLALRTAGRWIGKLRRLSGHFRTGLDAMVREAEMEELEKKWTAQNEKIMREHPADAPAEMERTGALPARPAGAKLPAPAEKTDFGAPEEGGRQEQSTTSAAAENRAAPASPPPPASGS